MPNGGSDCCMTCWFNSKNEGKAGRNRNRLSSEPSYCTIRDLPIRVAAYTYCANHPYRNPSRLEVPIGPVWEGTSDGYREVWKLAPNTEEVRLSLLNLLAQIQEKPGTEYPIGIYADEVIVWQVGELQEVRAMAELCRIAEFSPDAQSDDAFCRSRRSTVAAALKAIEKIEGKTALDFPSEPVEKEHPLRRND